MMDMIDASLIMSLHVSDRSRHAHFNMETPRMMIFTLPEKRDGALYLSVISHTGDKNKTTQ